MSTTRITVTETRVETPSEPMRLGLWLRFRRWLFALRRVLPQVPGILRTGWRSARMAWRLGRELAAIAKEIQAERDANVPNGTTPAPVGPGLLNRLAGASSSAGLSVGDYARDTGFMLVQAGLAVKHYEQSGRGALVVNFVGEPLRPRSAVYFPLKQLERMKVGAVILDPVGQYDPMSQAVVVLAGDRVGDVVKACLVGVERIGHPCAQG